MWSSRQLLHQSQSRLRLSTGSRCLELPSFYPIAAPTGSRGCPCGSNEIRAWWRLDWCRRRGGRWGSCSRVSQLSVSSGSGSSSRSLHSQASSKMPCLHHHCTAWLCFGGCEAIGRHMVHATTFGDCRARAITKGGGFWLAVSRVQVGQWTAKATLMARGPERVRRSLGLHRWCPLAERHPWRWLWRHVATLVAGTLSRTTFLLSLGLG